MVLFLGFQLDRIDLDDLVRSRGLDIIRGGVRVQIDRICFISIVAYIEGGKWGYGIRWHDVEVHLEVATAE